MILQTTGNYSYLEILPCQILIKPYQIQAVYR